MNILFLTMIKIDTIYSHGIYTDLIRELVKRGNHVVVLTPLEKRYKQQPKVLNEETCTIIQVHTGNLQKCGVIEKGFSQLSISRYYIKTLKKSDRYGTFDLILYATPPITLLKVITYIKNRDHAKTFLMLKDIFPQNAVDLCMLSTKGVKGILYRYYKNLERKLYQISDKIGCMSPRNIEYLLDRNPWIDRSKVSLFPNAIEPKSRVHHRERFVGEPVEFLYGGNLGKPQSIDFMLSCIDACQDIKDAHFTICGTGTELHKIQNYYEEKKPKNLTVIPGLPEQEYEKLVQRADVGLIFLDYRFTIPNFPSRLLSYLEEGIPVLACTDTSTDIGRVIVDNHCGWWCPSNNIRQYKDCIQSICMEKSFLGTEMNYQVRCLLSKYNISLVLDQSGAF